MIELPLIPAIFVILITFILLAILWRKIANVICKPVRMLFKNLWEAIN